MAFVEEGRDDDGGCKMRSGGFSLRVVDFIIYSWISILNDHLLGLIQRWGWRECWCLCDIDIDIEILDFD